MDQSPFEVYIDSMKPYIKQFSQQIAEAQQRANDFNLPFDVQSLKEIENIFSVVTESMQSSTKFDEYRVIPSKCIHNNSPYCTSQNLIRFLVRCLSDTVFRGKQMLQFHTIMNVMCGMNQQMYKLCFQCAMEFVIQTNKFQIVIDSIKSILNHGTYKRISDKSMHTTFLSLQIYQLLNMVLTESKIIQIFCRNSKNIKALLHLFKYMTSPVGIEQMKVIIPGIKVKTREGYMIFSGLLGILFGFFRRKQFKIVIKMNILQHMCSSICSDLFCNRTLKVCNKYELMNVFFVQEFRILYQILTYKYKHLVEESILNDVIHTLESWNEQTKCFAEFLQDVERTSANVLIEPKMMKIFALNRLNDTLKCARISTTMCFNSKCVKHVKKNLNKKKWKFKLCSGCMIALYCNKKCQKYHWKFGHKTQCYWFQEHKI
eukprot:95871_1